MACLDIEKESFILYVESTNPASFLNQLQENDRSHTKKTSFSSVGHVLFTFR